jgi:hypothetical protein
MVLNLYPTPKLFFKGFNFLAVSKVKKLHSSGLYVAMSGSFGKVFNFLSDFALKILRLFSGLSLFRRKLVFCCGVGSYYPGPGSIDPAY